MTVSSTRPKQIVDKKPSVQITSWTSYLLLHLLAAAYILVRTFVQPGFWPPLLCTDRCHLDRLSPQVFRH